MKTVYLDNGSTTIVDPEVADIINKFNLKTYGNASSVHHKGFEAKQALEESRNIIAKSLGARDSEIIFTSGGTESNNLAIKGLAFANKDKGNHIITTKIEHECVLKSCKWLETQGFKVTYLDVDKGGFIGHENLKQEITKDTILVSVIHGNNEIGTIQDLDSIYKICKKNQVYFHTDACQSYTKTKLSAEDADLISLNAHKLHGPKGVGALFIKQGVHITPLAHGGGQEYNFRSGTENIPAIVGFAKAVSLAIKQNYNDKMTELRDFAIREILQIPNTSLNGPTGDKRLCNNINVSFKYIEGESIVTSLDTLGICASTASACSSHTLEPSHVLMALENNAERAHSSVRFTISRFTTKKELEFTINELKKIVERLRKISPLTNDKGMDTPGE